MSIHFSDTATASFYPFTLTRGVEDLRIGLYTIRERWEAVQPPPAEQVDPFLLPGWAPAERLNNITDLLRYNNKALRADITRLIANHPSASPSATNRITRPEAVFMEAGAVMEHCIINADTGPVYIGKNVQVMEGSLLRGPLALCEGTVVKMGTRIYGASTIGPYCTVGGELKQVIMLGYSNKAHDGYLGDAIIGEWCNLGAGTSNSNVKNTGGDITLKFPGSSMSAGNKFGLLMGDYSRAAINTSFNTGTTVGVCCNVFGNGLTPSFIPSFSWGTTGDRYRLDKAFDDISNWKKMKGSAITLSEKQLLTHIFEAL